MASMIKPCRDSNVLVGMPTTDVLINSVEKRTRNFSQKSHGLPSQEQEACAENVTVVDLLSDFICESESRKNYLKLHCRVSIALSVCRNGQSIFLALQLPLPS